MIWPAAIARKIAASTKEGKLLALLGDIAMQDEVGKQGLQAYGAEAGHLPVSVVQAEVAEQAEVKGWLRPLHSFNVFWSLILVLQLQLPRAGELFVFGQN